MKGVRKFGIAHRAFVRFTSRLRGLHFLKDELFENVRDRLHFTFGPLDVCESVLASLICLLEQNQFLQNAFD